jgi:hypothetical protein
MFSDGNWRSQLELAISVPLIHLSQTEKFSILTEISTPSPFSEKCRIGEFIALDIGTIWMDSEREWVIETKPCERRRP